jgi:hypothetical protein
MAGAMRKIPAPISIRESRGHEQEKRRMATLLKAEKRSVAAKVIM